MMLRRPPQKKLSSEQRRQFWKKYAVGEIKENKKRQFTRNRSRMPVYASPTLMGTVRRFRSKKDLLEHIKIVSKINRLGIQTKFETFEFQPTQILAIDRKKLQTVERVYRAPNTRQILEENPENGFGSPFGKQFWRRMQQKGVSLEELRKALNDANNEISTKILHNPQAPSFDFFNQNILLLDFDPETKKPLIAIVDHGNSMRT
jgi:hypothetical protein